MLFFIYKMYILYYHLNQSIVFFIKFKPFGNLHVLKLNIKLFLKIICCWLNLTSYFEYYNLDQFDDL